MECLTLSSLNPTMQFKSSVELSFIIKYNITEISKCFKSLQLAKYECFKDEIVLFYSAMVRSRDSKSSSPRSNLGGTSIYINL